MTSRHGRCIMEGSTRHGPMNAATRSALLALGAAIAADPDAMDELAVYGDLPDHLADAVADYEDDDK